MKLDNYQKTLRLAVLGYGCRGQTMLELLLDMPDIRVTAVCDTEPDRLEAAAHRVRERQGSEPFASAVSLECVQREDVDAVVIFTAWEAHIPQAIEAMRCGKPAAMEVGGALSVEACWQLVRTKEETGIPVMLLENCCYGETELTLLNMLRKGLFGTLVHCEGSYAHDLRDEIGLGDLNRHYRQRHFLHRNGELYPTHELGPIATWLGINHGNRMVSLVSMASKACGLHEWLQEHRPDSPALQNAQVNEGDIVTTMIKCANGETIILKHDCTLPRPYSRGGCLRGTKGMWLEDNRSCFIEGHSPVDPTHWTHRWESDKRYMEEYRPPIWQEYRRIGERGGHDGMDFLVLRAFIESVRDNTPPPIDVYDAAAWMSVTALSEQSIALGSQPLPMPDFTSGRWLQERKDRAAGPFALFEK